MSRVVWFCLPAAVLFVLLPGSAAAKSAASPNCGATITSSITLAVDLDCSAGGPGLIVGKSGIVINLNGHAITGAGGADGNTGIDNNSGYGNVTVKNGTISDFAIDYASNGAKGETVTKVHFVLDNSQNTVGLTVQHGTSNTYSHNTVTNAAIGIESDYNVKDKFTANTLTGNANAVHEFSVTHDTWTGNNFSHSATDGYWEEQSSPVLIGNVSSHNVSDGFDLRCDSAGYAVVSRNSANYNGGSGIHTLQCSIGSSHSSFAGNKTSHNADSGIYSFSDPGATFTGNTANKNANYGFYVLYPAGSVFKANVTNGNGVGGVGQDGIFMDTYAGADVPSLFTKNTSSNNGRYGYEADSLVVGSHDKGSGNGQARFLNVSG